MPGASLVGEPKLDSLKAFASETLFSAAPSFPPDFLQRLILLERSGKYQAARLTYSICIQIKSIKGLFLQSVFARAVTCAGVWIKVEHHGLETAIIVQQATDRPL